MRQQHPRIAQNEPKLITNGFFRYTRNPNYFGEILIYSSFGVTVHHRAVWAALFLIWGTVFAMMIFVKEMSLSRKKGWAKYKSETNLIFPRISSNFIIDWLFWLGGFLAFFYLEFDFS